MSSVWFDHAEPGSNYCTMQPKEKFEWSKEWRSGVSWAQTYAEALNIVTQQSVICIKEESCDVLHSDTYEW